MALVNSKKTSFFLSPNSSVLPTPPEGAIETMEAVVPVPEFASIDINRMTGKMNSKESIIDTCAAKVDFSVEHAMRTSDVGATALETPPGYGILLKAAGFAEVIDTTVDQETVSYTNGIDSMPTSSALVYVDGNKFSFTGALSSSFDIVLEIGQIAKMDSTFFGYIDDPAPVPEANPSVTLSSENPLVVSCADLVTYDGTCLPLKKVTISMNPENTDIYTIGGTCGIKSNLITDYALTLEAEFFVDSDTYDREITNIEAGAARAIEIKLGLDADSNLVNGKSLLITADLATTVMYEDSPEDDLLSRKVTYRLMDGVTPAITFKTGFFS